MAHNKRDGGLLTLKKCYEMMLKKKIRMLKSSALLIKMISFQKTNFISINKEVCLAL